MTSISQPALPPQGPNSAPQNVAPAQPNSASLSGRTPPQAAGTAPPPARSYASATKKQSSPTSAITPATSTVPSGATGQSQHGKLDSISSANGKSAITPAVPAVGGGPAAVNGKTPTGPSGGPIDHGRKPSVTITSAGTSGYLPNGGQAGTKPANGKDIQFGTFNPDGSPALANAVPQLSQPSDSLAVNNLQNPRVTTPGASPSPIPQPPASGGKPPPSSQNQTNGVSFGSLPYGEDPTRQMRSGMPQSNLGPGPQPSHLRRESSQSAHSELGTPGMTPAANRGGYPQQGGRGRGGYNGQYTHQQQMGYGQPPNFTRTPSQPRGAPPAMSSPFPQRQTLATPYAPSPHQATRSPNLAYAQPVPGQNQVNLGQTPAPHLYGEFAQYAGQAQVKPQSSSSSSRGPSRPTQKNAHFFAQDQPLAVQPLDLAPDTGHFEQYLTEIKQNHQYAPHMFNPQYAAYYHQFGMPGMHQQYMQQMPPSSPRPSQQMPQGPHQQYGQGPYGHPSHPPSMSRTSSAISMSAERPSSSMGKSQTPMTNPAASNTPISSRPANSPAPKTSSGSFKIPDKKNASLLIKDPNSGAVKSFDRKPSSPAPLTPSPAVAPATPTPPPPSAAGTDSSHVRSESKSVKTNEEKRNDMKDAIARKVEEDKAEERRKQDAEDSRVAAEKKEADDKLVREKEDAEAKELETAKAQVEAQEAASKEKTEADEAEKAAAKAKGDAEEAARKEREEDEEFARIEAEMERKEKEAEERYQAKKKAESEEKARKDTEAAKTLDEELKRAEREAEEIEEAREKKRKENEGDDSQKESKELFRALKKDSAIPSASGTPAIAETPNESGTQTPNLEASMAPPRAAASKSKPAVLKLETTKAVESPQPSAQLLSLRSARRLTSLNDVSYPSGFASPNPALNTAAPMGKFRYDKNFLVQFQTVFVEKPSEDWSSKIKETLGGESGEPASARTGSARAGGSMGPRAPSKNGPSMQPMMGGMGTMGGGMGSFGARPSAPVGRTSEARFQASNQQLGSQQRGMQNPFAPHITGGRTGGFPVGGPQQMDRVPSSTGMGSHPHSPRGNASQRGSASRNSKTGRTRENEKDAKSMPLTAGTTLRPIETTEKGWKPMSVGASAFGMAGPAPGGDNHMAPDVVQRKVKSNLNKMTPNNFDKISDQILAIAAQSKEETDGRTLRQVIQLTFEKATDEAHWAEMYAQFCKRMLESMSPEIKDESVRNQKGEIQVGGALFRKYLLTRCQTEFEQGWKVNLPEKPEGESEEAAMLSDEYYKAAAAKRRGLGLVRFIGELYKLNMLTERIMHECVKKLVDYEGTPDEAEVESLTSLLKTIGANLDSSDKGHQLMDIYFARIQVMMDIPGLASRLKFMLMDIGDLRKKNWQSSKAGALKAPATLEQVRAEAAETERQKEMQRQADAGARRGGGGGNRPAMGRGDARQFSGGGPFGGMPPPDFTRNTVDMSDLRRLGRGGSRQASQAGAPSLGPPSTSMFGPRGSNTRKPLGATGVAKAGEDSAASSRTGTPPAQKEKKEKEEKEAAAKHTNAFSALAGLDNAGEPADPASPPSVASSPPNTKLGLAQRQRSKSPLGQKDDEKPEGEAS